MSTYNQKQLIAEAKSGMVQKIYFIYGNDVSLVIQSTNFLLEKILGKEYDLYLQRIDGSSAAFDFSSFSDQLQMYPFGCSFNCILINDWNSEKRKADENKKMLEILKNDLNDTSVVIFNITGFDICDGKAKPAAKHKKLIDFAEKNGAVAVCNTKSESELAREIVSYVKKKGCSISSANAVRIAQECLCQSDSVRNETDKLCSYTGSGEITSETISMLVTKQESMKIYALSNAILLGNTAQVIHNFNILIDEMEPEQIMYMLSDSFISWYRARTALINRINPSEMQSDFGYRFTFAVNNAFRDCRRFSVTVLRKCIILLFDAQKKINSMSRINKNIIIEQTLIEIMQIMKG